MKAVAQNVLVQWELDLFIYFSSPVETGPQKEYLSKKPSPAALIA